MGRGKSIMAVAAVATVSLHLVGGAKAEIFKNFPDVVICTEGDDRTAFYIGFAKADGSVLYRTPGQDYVTVTPDHVLHHHGSKDCDGETLEQLEKDGQTRVFH
jgi:hypothetical protein